MNEPVKRDYSSDELTVHWDSAKCVHCGNCVRGLPEVFNVKASPWINLSGADSERVVAQVKNCPSGALSVTILKA